MNAIKLIASTLTGCLIGAQTALAIGPAPLPVDDAGLLLAAAVGLLAVIKIARTKDKR